MQVSVKSSEWGDGRRQDDQELEEGRHTLGSRSKDHIACGLALHINNGYHTPYLETRQSIPVSHAPDGPALHQAMYVPCSCTSPGVTFNNSCPHIGGSITVSSET